MCVFPCYSLYVLYFNFVCKINGGVMCFRKHFYDTMCLLDL